MIKTAAKLSLFIRGCGSMKHIIFFQGFNGTFTNFYFWPRSSRNLPQKYGQLCKKGWNARTCFFMMICSKYITSDKV